MFMNKILNNNFTKGFTLIELMITLAVIGVLITIAAPNFSAVIKNNCITTKTNTLISSLQYARSEATKRKKQINITKNSSGWSFGWDISEEGKASDPIKVINFSSCGTTTMEPKDTFSKYSYKASGFPTTTKTKKIINVCDDRGGEIGREISVSVTGRPSFKQHECL